MTIPYIDDMQISLAMVPLVGAMAIREFWSRIQLSSDLRAREARVQAERHQAVRAMQDALIAKEAAQKTREEFLARMSHELRTPLNAVIGLSRVLEKNEAGNQRAEDLRLLSRVRASGELLLRMIEDVLEQAHLGRGHVDISVEQTDVVPIIKRVVQSYRSAGMSKGLRVLAVVPESAPTVPLDARRFEEVVKHLVDNAVKFTVSGVVKVTLVFDAGTRLPTRLIVADTGIGIPEAQLDRIFEPFEQVDASPRRVHGGAGLGLPLARRLCEKMRCRLSVESEVGRGSRFAVRFPNAD